MAWCSRRSTLTKERTTIGRKPHNDIQIDNLAVSGEHAVIVTILNDSFLEDLGSTNGTVVNGKPVKKHFLQNNDVIELGKYKLKFIGEAPAGAARRQADFEKTMVLRPSAMKAAAEQAAGGAAGGAPRRPRRRRLQRAAQRRSRRHADRRRRRRQRRPRPLPQRLPRQAAPPRAGRTGAAARRDPAALRRQCRQGARAHQAAHHARQARRAGRGA